MKTLLFLLLTVTACGQSKFVKSDKPIEFCPLLVDGGESSLRLDTCGVITIKGDTMHVIKQMIMGLLRDYTIVFRDPEISATKGMRTEYKANYDAIDTLSGILWKWSSDSVTWGSYLARQEIVIDTVPPDTSVIYYEPAEMPYSIPGMIYGEWDNVSEIKWTEHTEVLRDPLTVCNHDWVQADNRGGMYSSPYVSCNVFHGPCGCPDKWPDIKKICKNCGYHLRVYRTCETVIENKESYEDVVKRFK